MSKIKHAVLALSALALVACGGGSSQATGLLEECTISFESNGGSSVSPIKVLYGKTASKPADPTRSGYSFDGWFADSYLKVSFDWSQSITADWTLYAGWTYGGGGGDSSSSDSSVEPTPSSETSTPSSESSEEPSGALTLYFKDVAWWAADGARSGIYLWNGANKNAAWPGEAMESLGSGMWKFTLDDPSAYTNLIFTRISPAEPIADWGAKTIDLAIADIDPEKPLYDISSQTTPSWGDPGVSGNWVAYNA